MNRKARLNTILFNRKARTRIGIREHDAFAEASKLIERGKICTELVDILYRGMTQEEVYCIKVSVQERSVITEKATVLAIAAAREIELAILKKGKYKC